MNPANKSILRQCGICAFCCVQPEIPEIHKRMFARCKHVKLGCTGACGIYSIRPDVCRNFTCLWLQGQINIQKKPSLLGVMVYQTTEKVIHFLEIQEGKTLLYFFNEIDKLLNDGYEVYLHTKTIDAKMITQQLFRVHH